jgi:hypothetical protein
MTFPALNNGYVYPAASRISLHRSRKDWSIVFECFGFSPRAFTPYIFVTTFGSRPFARKTPDAFRERRAFEQYLRAHPLDDSEAVFPLETGDWHNENDVEIVRATAVSVQVRGRVIPLPNTDAYLRYGIALMDPPRVRVFELCRYLAAVARNDILATPVERRVHVNPDLTEILVLDEWYQPDTVDDELPSATATFQQFADVLAKGGVGRYRPAEAPNTHWSNWPEAGTL